MVKIETKLPKEKKKKAKKKSRKQVRLTIILVISILFVFTLAFGYWAFRIVMSPNVQTPDGKETVIFIPTGSTYDDVKSTLDEGHYLANENSFNWVAQRKEYPQNIRPGRYVLKNGMSNNQLVNMLRGGLQSPVNVTFNNIRDVDQLAGRIAKQIEADSTSISQLFHNQEYIGEHGFNNYTIPALFLRSFCELVTVEIQGCFCAHDTDKILHITVCFEPKKASHFCFKTGARFFAVKQRFFDRFGAAAKIQLTCFIKELFVIVQELVCVLHLLDLFCNGFLSGHKLSLHEIRLDTLPIFAAKNIQKTPVFWRKYLLVSLTNMGKLKKRIDTDKISLV